MKMLKTHELRPCENCGGAIAPVFYRMTISFRQLGIDYQAANAVLGTAQVFGGNLAMGRIMSPDQDATFELGYKIDKDYFLCQSCVTSCDLPLRPLDLMIEYDEAGDTA